MTLKTKHRGARLRGNSFSAADNTVDLTWTTGAPCLRLDEEFGEQYIETLSLEPGAVILDRLNLGAPFLDSHCSDGLDKIIGSVVPQSARIEGGKGVCKIQLSKAPGVADTVTKIREGVIRNVSVGYMIHSATRTEGDKGQPCTLRVDLWEPYELSAVAVPADSGAQVRSRGHAGSAPTFGALSEAQRGALMASRLSKTPVSNAALRALGDKPTGRATLIEVAQRANAAAENQRREREREHALRRAGNRWGV